MKFNLIKLATKLSYLLAETSPIKPNFYQNDMSMCKVQQQKSCVITLDTIGYLVYGMWY
jgi:hypothetical protein